jgi:predicted permease
VDQRTQLVATGAGWALAIALPAALLAQVADAATSGDSTSPLVYPCVAIVLVGMLVGGGVVGGRMAGRTSTDRPATAGALAALAAIAVVQLLGVLRAEAAGDHVAWASIPFLLALGAGLGAGGALIGRAWAGRTRP